MDATSLRTLYQRFLRTPGRVLLTGHSHQAWPDVAFRGVEEGLADAAALVDDKWGRAMARADRVRRAVSDRIGGRPEEVALAPNTHQALLRFLSALDWGRRRRVVSTGGEFHSVARQLRRLAEVGAFELTEVEPQPASTLAERIAARVDDSAAAVVVSAVLFETAACVPHLEAVTAAAHRAGAHVFYDAYHAFNIVPLRLSDLGPDPVFYSAGGYKYAQWGEGVCFLRVPPEPALKPVITGWFSDFENLDRPRDAGPVSFGPRPCDRFAGSTYDPLSHYRAAAVADFFDAQGLTVGRLRELSLRQTALLLGELEGFEIASPRDEARAGFVAVRVEGAGEVVRQLRERGVWADARGELLRLGPAPYLLDEELVRGAAELREVVRP